MARDSPLTPCKVARYWRQPNFFFIFGNCLGSSGSISNPPFHRRDGSSPRPTRSQISRSRSVRRRRIVLPVSQHWTSPPSWPFHISPHDAADWGGVLLERLMVILEYQTFRGSHPRHRLRSADLFRYSSLPSTPCHSPVCHQQSILWSSSSR